MAPTYTASMSMGSEHLTWVEVDLGAIENNTRYFIEHTGCPVMAVVKANGYGHGAVEVAIAARRAGASWFGVARTGEAMQLRREGIEEPILILGATPVDRFAEMISANVSLTVWSTDQIQAASKAAHENGDKAHLHLKVDTGMSRLGTEPEAAVELALHIIQTDGVVFEGVFTQYARADEADPEPTDAHENLFSQVLEALEEQDLRPVIRHSTNSAASLTRASTHLDLVRVGIALYGLHPSSECQLPETFRPGLAWKSTLTQVKNLPPGRGVSYGHKYVTSGTERIGTVPVGYADGFRRTGGNQVLIRGQRVQVVGTVTMDQCMVQLDSVPEANEGDEVVIIGSQGDSYLTAEDLAVSWGTFNYEVTCGISKRVPRIYS